MWEAALSKGFGGQRLDNDVHVVPEGPVGSRVHPAEIPGSSRGRREPGTDPGFRRDIPGNRRDIPGPSGT